MSASPFSLGVRILGAGAAVLVLFLGIGFALPGTWSAEHALTVPATPEQLFPLLVHPRSWQAWTAWPERGIDAEGPETGVGARLTWDDPELGDGSFELVEVVPLTRVRYRVEVEGGSMHTDGVLTLEADGGGTRVTWREDGDFGWNPLMGYWARLMERVQGRELAKALERLGTAATNASAPADVESTGAEGASDSTAASPAAAPRR